MPRRPLSIRDIINTEPKSQYHNNPSGRLRQLVSAATHSELPHPVGGLSRLLIASYTLGLPVAGLASVYISRQGPRRKAHSARRSLHGRTALDLYGRPLVSAGWERCQQRLDIAEGLLSVRRTGAVGVIACRTKGWLYSWIGQGELVAEDRPHRIPIPT